MKHAEQVHNMIANAAAWHDYAAGLHVIQSENGWRRGLKFGPENTRFDYADGSSLWWSPERTAWLAGY